MTDSRISQDESSEINTISFNDSKSEETNVPPQPAVDENVATAEEYEKETMIGVLQRQARIKLDKIEDKINKTVNAEQLFALFAEKEAIQKELSREIEELQAERKQYSEPEAEMEVTEDYVYNDIVIKAKLYNYLFQHQRTGVKWMLDLYTQGKGGLLADEMGLGKTLQVISYVYALFTNKLINKVLILCPATVVHIWEEEFNHVFKLAPSVTISSEFISRGVTIMSYGLFKSKNGKYIMRNRDQPIGSENMHYDAVFLDEGHKIKNKDSQIALLCKNIKSKINYVISGTPIQNNLDELWSVFDFIDPSILGSINDFRAEYVEHIRGNTERAYRFSVMLRSTIEPYILRRMKSNVGTNLPSKLDKVVLVTLSSLQNRLYFQELEKIRVCSRRMTNHTVFKYIDLLRKICNHPLLVEQNSHDYNYSNCDVVSSSSKMVALVNLLRRFRKDNKRVLVFTQTIQMQNIIEKAMGEFTYHKMNGTVELSRRKHLIDDFNSNQSVFCFLLTTKVGGLGLNLTGACRIIIYDPDWNPSVDAQAKERIYRYGQKEDVEIYRLVCRNTVEEKIYQKQIYKDCLSKRVLKNPKVFIEKDTIDLFSYGIPMQQGDEIIDDKNYKTEENKLKVRDVDKKEFNVMRDSNMKLVLTGRELIDYIIRRESALECENMEKHEQ